MTHERYRELQHEAIRYGNHIDPWWEMADTPSCTTGYKAMKQHLQVLLREERDRQVEQQFEQGV